MARRRKPPRTTTRARARARDVDALVLEVVRQMVAGTWSREAAEKLATRERVTLDAVQQWASDAGRLLRIGPDVELYRGVNLQRLDAVYATASGDYKARVAAVAEQNRMLGLSAQHHKVDVTVQAYERLPPDAMLGKVRAQIVELRELERRLVEKVEGGNGRDEAAG